MTQGPLEDIRVLELGSTVAGPFCARLLADFGADVVKIEVPEGDPVRSFGKRYDGKSLYASSIFRNKKMASINLREERGRELIKTLVRKFDVLIENFKPGTMERWGLGYEDLREINPSLIMVRISGFGQTGPYSHKPGYGVVCEAVSGMRHLTGDSDRPAARVAVSLTDEITGTYAAYGVALAVLHKRATGKGQCIDAALYECAFSYMEPYVPAYEKTGFVPTRQGGRLPNSTPNNHYPTKDGQYIHIAAGNLPTWRRLATAMGRADLLEDPRLLDQVSLNENEDEIDDIVGAWTQLHSIEELERKLDEAAVPASRIYTMEDVFNDPHYAAREMIVDVLDDDLGSVKLANIVPRLSETPGEIRKAGGQPGVDTRSVLGDFTDLTGEEITALEADGVIYCGEGTAGAD
ncbi:MAG: CoA transferase [Pseudomonadota bacterium]|nr:CoA transferase [Pseudomonadota bacterium]